MNTNQPIFPRLTKACFLVCTILFISCYYLPAQPSSVILNAVPTPSGHTIRLADFASAYVTPRHVDIWIPDSFSPTRPHTKLYMHDGQMLFDSTSTWNRQAWEADDAAAQLINTNQIPPVCIIGIWNAGPKRHEEYFPEKVYTSLSAKEKQQVTEQLATAGRSSAIFTPRADAYLLFITTEVMPYVDSLLSSPSYHPTYIAGSSMGGLISWYALTEYPEKFKGAACISTHWPGVFSLENNPLPLAFERYLKQHLPAPGRHVLYFDCGDQQLDALYPDIQRNIDAMARKLGFTEEHWASVFYPGQDHSEKAWKQRLPDVLKVLFR